MKQADEQREAMKALHDAIMNLPCEKPSVGWGATQWAGYKEGHRDARHAAAELALAAALPPAAEQAGPTPGYTREGFLRLLHERLAASHLAGRDGEGFPVSSLKLLMHYFDQLVPDEGTLTAGKQGGAGVKEDQRGL